MPDVLFYEAFEEEAEAIRRCLPGGIDAGFTDRTIQEHGALALPAGIISIRTQSKIPPEWAGALTAILTRSTGYDHVNAYRRDHPGRYQCGYLPLYCARGVAEQAALLWMALLRKLPDQAAHFDAFDRDGITGRETMGRNLLVVGVGNIGYEAVRIGRGLGMNVQGVDIVQRHADVDYTDIDEGMASADVVVCAMNLTDRNAGYFSMDRFRKARPGAVFVNIARGELSPTRDLVRALDEGLLGGVALDVYENESVVAVALRLGQASQSPACRYVLDLRHRPNVILTPHNAFNTEEAVDRKARQSIEQVVHLLKTGSFLWPLPD